MQKYQQEFIRFALEYKVLKFGDFTLKSGRNSPYFFNTGLFNTGFCLARLGEFYAEAAMQEHLIFDQIFGPAYKGIPIASATVIALVNKYNIDVPYVFNRKEAKNHGEGGNTMGAALTGRVLILDDVISDGVSKSESIELIRQAGAEPAGILIALDRQERGTGTISAVAEIEKKYGVKVSSIIKLSDILDFLADDRSLSHYHETVADYRRHYGA